MLIAVIYIYVNYESSNEYGYEILIFMLELLFEIGSCFPCFLVQSLDLYKWVSRDQE
jgi:hypothetical protein